MADHDLDPTEGVETPPSRANSQPAPPPQKPRHSPRLLALAASLGIPEDEAAGYSASELQQAILIEQNQRAHQKAGAPPPPPEEEDPLDLGLDPALVDESILKALEKLRGEALTSRKKAKEYAELLKKAEERAQKYEQAEQSRGQRELNDKLDALFLSCPELFGTDSWEELEPNSLEHLARSACWQKMQKLPGSFKQKFAQVRDEMLQKRGLKGKRPQAEPDVDEEEEHLVEPPPPRRKPRGRDEEAALQEERERWERNGGTASPSHRRSPEVDDDSMDARVQKARKAVRNKVRQLGLNGARVAGGDQDEEGLLPE